MIFIDDINVPIVAFAPPPALWRAQSPASWMCIRWWKKSPT
jgi:hypothetical protein